ncbi:MAG: hypothetical protein QXH08_03970 [Candidatus Hadarchaeales archaeon]
MVICNEGTAPQESRAGVKSMNAGASLREHWSFPPRVHATQRVLWGESGGASIDDPRANPGVKQVGAPEKIPPSRVSGMSNAGSAFQDSRC